MDNRSYVKAGVVHLSGIISDSITVAANSAIRIDPIEGRCGIDLAHSLATNLTARGFRILLANAADPADFSLQTTVKEYSLRYRAVGGRLFRQSRIERSFSISAGAVLSTGTGKFVRALHDAQLVQRDTLSFAEARQARGDDPFLAPPLPPGVFQRVVEPSIVVGITGALVYFFFASR